eukprot:gene9447-11991_t
MTLNGEVLDDEKTLAFYDISASSEIQHEFLFPHDKVVEYTNRKGNLVKGRIFGQKLEGDFYEVININGNIARVHRDQLSVVSRDEEEEA